jgi:hypothetical protein
MRILLRLVVLPVLLLAGLLWWLKFEHGAPTVTIDPDTATVGRDVLWKIGVDASGSPGLRQVVVSIDSGGKLIELLRQDYPSGSWFGGGVPSATVVVGGNLTERGVSEGPARLAIEVDTHAWHIIPRRQGVLTERTLTIDLTPPNAQLLTTQHNIRLGGAGLALVRVPADATSEVGDYSFPVVRGYFDDPEVAYALFAVPQDLGANARPVVRVADAVGNAREIALPCNIQPRVFPIRQLQIDDAFLRCPSCTPWPAGSRPPIWSRAICT